MSDIVLLLFFTSGHMWANPIYSPRRWWHVALHVVLRIKEHTHMKHTNTKHTNMKRTFTLNLIGMVISLGNVEPL